MANKNNNNFKKRRFSSQNAKSKEVVKDNAPITKSESFNDPAWYGMDTALLRDSASVPFVYPMGAPVTTGIEIKPKMTIPGICAMELCPTTGFSTDPNSPINIAANTLYTYVRHANSGSRNYDSPNLMMYILAAADVYSYINYLQRVYGVAMLYNQMNRYIPDALFSAMHIDGKSIRDNLANFRYGINLLINKASSLAVPSDIPLFRRKAFIYSNIYKEGMSIKDQLYLFVPTGFYQYSDPGRLMLRPLVPGEIYVDTSAGATTSRYITGDHIDMNYQDLLNCGNDLIGTLLGSEDMGVMNGDILKAYGTNGILKLQEVPENYTISFAFDIAVLEQMKNAYICDLMYASSGSDVPSVSMRRSTFEKVNTSIKYNLPFIENTESVIYGPFIESRPCCKATAVDSGNKWITTQAEVVTPDIVMENSRLIPAVLSTRKLASGLSAVHAMTEVLVNVRYYQFDADGTTLQNTSTVLPYIQYEATGTPPSAVDLCRINAFRFHPFMYLLQGTTVAGKYELELFTNIDNYSICTNDVIYRLNETALMSLLNVPSVAKAY